MNASTSARFDAKPERDAHRAGALAVDAQPEVVDRQMRFVLGLMEARRQFGAGDAERDLAAAWIAEASGSQRDARGVRALFDVAVIDRRDPSRS